MKSSYSLTPKDCLYIEDALEQTLVISKRLNHEISLIKDSKAREVLRNACKKLTPTYTMLLQMLKEEK